MRPNKVIQDSELFEGRPLPAAKPYETLPGTPGTPQRMYVTGITLAMAGILTFFLALISAYIVRKGSPAEDWRPLTVPHVLWLNSAILVGSDFTLRRSRKNFLSGDESGFRHWWSVTAILGLFFLAGQMIAWRQLSAAGIHLSTNPSSSFFYLLTAAHGLHLLGGITALLIVLLRPTRYLTPRTATRVISIYWHFVGGLWICLFFLFLFNQ
jgi:cytochrome c oxidase subunit III